MLNTKARTKEETVIMVKKYMAWSISLKSQAANTNDEAQKTRFQMLSTKAKEKGLSLLK